MVQLVEKWVYHDDGTGDLPCTWETVVQAAKYMGKDSWHSSWQNNLECS